MDEAERQKVYAAIKNDNDNLNHASHVWTREGEIVGAASMAAIPAILMWHRSDRVRARDSLHFIRVYESVMDQMGFPRFWTLCNSNSPYREHMEEFGFKPIWETKLFMHGTGCADEIKNEPVAKISEPTPPRMR